MEDDIRPVVTSGCATEEFHIEHQREPRKGVPETRFCGREGPLHPFPRKPRHDVRFLDDIDVIVVIDELKILDLPVDGEG